MYERQTPQYQINCQIRTIFRFQYIENIVSCPGNNCNNLVNSSVINDPVSTPNFFTSNGYPKYLFDNTLHKFLHNIFIKNKTSDNQEKANLCFSSVFPDGKEIYNRQKYILTSITHYLKTARTTASFFQIKDSNPRQNNIAGIGRAVLPNKK